MVVFLLLSAWGASDFIKVYFDNKVSKLEEAHEGMDSYRSLYENEKIEKGLHNFIKSVIRIVVYILIVLIYHIVLKIFDD